ncbi:glycoside hydrolase family 78 protein [soil metagenome]
MKIKIIGLLIGCFVCMSAINALGLKPGQLTCEYVNNPLGIQTENPRFSWQYTISGRNQFQTAYEIVVAGNEADCKQLKGNVWQTKKVSSDQNIQVAFNGNSLQPFTRYYWRVRGYDGTNTAGEWSDIASFETAALHAADWQAKWISDGSVQFERLEDFYKADPMPLFRKQFAIHKKITAARIYLSGIGYSELYINNKKISDDVLSPGYTAYGKQVLYVTYDITSALTASKNTIGVMLGNGWYNPLPMQLFGRFNLRNAQQTGRPCLLAQILIEYTDGSKETIASDESWQTATGPVVRNNVYLGEEYDARLEKEFTDDNNWKNAVITKGPAGVLTAQMQPAIRITKVIQPISIQPAGNDTFIVDMGQNFAGVVRLKVKGSVGTTISCRYGEVLYPNGSLNVLTTAAGQIKEIWNVNGGPGSPKTAWQKDQYTLKGNGIETWNPRFTFHGFRYIEISGWPGEPTVNDIEGLRMNSNLEQEGTFACSNDMFNTLHEKIQWTFLSNVFSVQSDCPAREKMGYGADMVATAGAFMYNYNMANFYSKAVQDFANDQQTDGGITETAPYTGIADRGYGGASGPLGWQLAFSYLQKKLYDFYGDEKIIAKQYPALQKQLEFLQAKATDGLYYWDIGDHETIDPKAEAFSASCFYYHHVMLATEFAGILHATADSAKYSRLANNIRNAIVSKFWIPNTGRFDNATQAAQIFALWYHLSPEKDKTLEQLMQEYARHNWHVATGIFGTMMMFDVLRENDKNDIAYKLANQKDFPGWGYMLAQGATTLWESWQLPESSSMNHPMFGSVDEWFYKSLLGINAAAPGFKRIIIKPQAAALAWAKGSYKSMYGIIKSEWKESETSFELKVTVPVNTVAEIWLPATKDTPITEGGNNNFQSEIKFVKQENSYRVFSVGSGNYDFRVGK